MFKWKNKKAFTLIELLVWISIISILILGTTNIDYNRLSKKQNLEIFTNTIKSNFERIRNNSLSWKWIWVNLDIPDKWVVEYSTSSSWTILSKAYTWSNIVSNNNTLFKKGIFITKIRCLKLDWTENYTLATTETGSLEIIWSNIKLIWDCYNYDSTSKILELEVTDRINTKIVKINSLNWLVEIK